MLHPYKYDIFVASMLYANYFLFVCIYKASYSLQYADIQVHHWQQHWLIQLLYIHIKVRCCYSIVVHCYSNALNDVL